MAVCYLIMDQNHRQRSVNALNETTLYFITKDNQVKSLNRRNKDMLYKDTQNNFFQINLDGKWYDIDSETWSYIVEWTSWH